MCHTIWARAFRLQCFFLYIHRYVGGCPMHTIVYIPYVCMSIQYSEHCKQVPMYLLYTLMYVCVRNEVRKELHVLITIHSCCMCSLVYVCTYVCMYVSTYVCMYTYVRRSTIVLRRAWGFPLPLPHMCTTWTPGYPLGVAGSRHLRYTNIRTNTVCTCISTTYKPCMYVQCL